MVALIMFAYLGLSLTISAFMNFMYSRLKWMSPDRGSGGKGYSVLLAPVHLVFRITLRIYGVLRRFGR